MTTTRSDAGLATSLRISVSRLARRLRVERVGYGTPEAVLSDIQLAALSVLERHEAMTPGELAAHEKVQPPSMTRVITALEQARLVTRAAHPSDRRQVLLTPTAAGRDLVRRTTHPTDRRQVLLTVTDKGRALVQRMRRRKDAWMAKRLEELTPEERATLRAAAPIL